MRPELHTTNILVASGRQSPRVEKFPGYIFGGLSNVVARHYSTNSTTARTTACDTRTLYMMGSKCKTCYDLYTCKKLFLLHPTYGRPPESLYPAHLQPFNRYALRPPSVLDRGGVLSAQVQDGLHQVLESHAFQAARRPGWPSGRGRCGASRHASEISEPLVFGGRRVCMKNP